MARDKQLVTQVGYHYRFVGAFQEAARIVRSGALGDIHHVRAEAYGPVVLRAKGGTWRSSKNEGGGALYDYACHAIDLVNFVVGAPDGGERRGAPRRVLARRRGRGLLQLPLRQRRQRPALRELERRELPQDEHQGQVWGTKGRITPTARNARSTCASRTPRCPTLKPAGTCATRPS
jgi:hypothetical protein